MNSPLTRRHFILTATLAASSLGVPPQLCSQNRDHGHDASPRRTIKPVSYAQVAITDPFWRSKLDRVATATLQACVLFTEKKTGRIRNFEKAARRQGERHEGVYYDDSDVYKALEAIAYSLKGRPDSALEKKADDWIDKIAAAQLADGYLNTFYTLTGIERRWTDMEKHEDYCAGHLIEAAVAYYRTTGKRILLDVAIRFADHLDSTFRLQNRHWVSGHEEIELALMKLYHLTGHERYLRLAEWYLEQRGHGFGQGELWGEGLDPGYCQDAVPIRAQRKITGHAVRAMYLYAGVADVAMATGDPDYIQAMKAVWEDVVYRNMYVTGGIGSSAVNEGFKQDYHLPNAQAYCETCASVGMVLWNQRMYLLTGESQYIDVLERSLYNGALDGLSLRGDRFFYANPLASSNSKNTIFGSPGRSEWFGTACCPSNIARLVASVAGYLYGVSENGIWVNLFVSSTARLKVGKAAIALRVESNYPWDGRVKLTMEPERRTRCALRVRIPGWARNSVVPGDLYRFAQTESEKTTILLNGNTMSFHEEKGYAVLDREWRPGDVIELNIPMPVRKVVARTEVEANRNRYALQRGPLVYCVEGADNEDYAWSFVASSAATFSEQPHQILDEPIVALRSDVLVAKPTEDRRGLQLIRKPLTAVPYYAWANREDYDMQVWLPTEIEDIKINS